MDMVSMTLTHIELGVGSYIAGIITTIVMVIVYEKLLKKHSSSGVLCDGCQRRLDDTVGGAAGAGVPQGRFTGFRW
jgi:hypothetical protein